MYFKIGISLAAVIILGAVFRFYHLDKIPNSISADEASFGYNAYSLLLTSRDEFGHQWPLSIRSFDDYKNPLFAYFLIPFVRLGGLNDLTIRVPSALLGVGIIMLFYLLTQTLTGKAKLSLVAAFLAAVSPWLIQYSRVAIDVNIGLFTGLLAAWLWVKGRHQPIYYLLAAITFVLSFYAYHASKLWLPFILPALVLLYGRFNRYLFLSLTIVALGVLPYVISLKTSPLVLRPWSVSLFSSQLEKDKDTSWRVNDQRLNLWGGGLFHSHWLTPVNQAINGYLFILSPQLLFATNSGEQIDNTRFFFIWELPLIIVGGLILARQITLFLLITYWLFIGFLPGGLTSLPVFDRRIFMAAYPLIFLASLGLVTAFERIKTKIPPLIRPLVWVLVIPIAASVIFYSHNYFVHGPRQVVSRWDNGMKELVTQTEMKKGHYNKIVVSKTLNQPLTFFLYYTQYSPEKYLATGGTISGGFREEGNHFDKYYFQTIKTDTLSKKVLYVSAASDSTECLTPIQSVFQTDGRLLAKLAVVDSTPKGCQDLNEK